MVAVFARVPMRGRVKTRLMASLGEEGALAAHTELLERTLARLAPVDDVAALELWWDDEPGAAATRPEPSRVQARGDLGARMSSAIDDITSRGHTAIVVGTDCPLLDGAYVRSALAALQRADVVIGPAEDGGYTLIAMARSQPVLFEEVRWGTGFALADTLFRAHGAGLEVRLLNYLWDVDEAADWRRYRVLRARELINAERLRRVRGRASAARP